MTNTIVTVSILAIIALNILIAFFRGVGKARIRGASMAGCAVLAVVIAVLARDLIVTEKFMNETFLPLLESLSGNVEMLLEMLNISTTLNEVLMNTVASLLLPTVCLVAFLLLAFLSWIGYLVVALIMGDKLSRKAKKVKLGFLRSMLWGAVQGVAIVVMILIPISTYTGYAPAVSEAVIESNLLDEQMAQTVETIIKDEVEPANNGILQVYRSMGGQALNNLFADFEANGHDVHMSDEIDSIASLTINVYRLSQSKIAEYGDAEALIFLSIADSFEGSVLLPTIAGEIIYDATGKWMSNVAFFGVARPSFGDMNAIFDPFFSKLLEILNGDARNTEALQTDFRTVADMVSTLAKFGVFASLSETDQLLEVISTSGVVNKLVLLLGQNPTMKALVPEITNMGMRAIATTLEIPENAEQIYDEFVDDVVYALNDIRKLGTEQEQIAALTTKLNTAFDEAGIDVDPALVDCYSISMINDLVKTTDVTTEADVQDFLTLLAFSTSAQNEDGSETDDGATDALSARGTLPLASAVTFKGTAYANMSEEQLQASGAAALATAYVELASTQSTGAEAGAVVMNVYAELLVTDPETLQKLGEITLTVAVTEQSVEVTASLKSADTVKNVTQKVTLEDLLVDSTIAADAIAAETVEAEAEAIASIFNAAADLSKKMEHGNEIKLEDVASTVGGILDNLNQTASFGSDKTADLFTAVLQSETVRETVDLDVKTATQMAQAATKSNGSSDAEDDNASGNSKGSYSQTLGAISGSITVVSKLGKDGEEVTQEELVQLIRDINPQTAGMIEVYLTAERLEGFNVPTDYSALSSEMIRSTFHYMANENLNDYDAEAKALNQILSIALSAKDHSSANSLYSKDGQEGILPGTAAETVDTFMSSDAISYGLRSTMLDENGAVIEEKRDPFGLSGNMNEESGEYQETFEAIKAYYEAHDDAQTRATLLAISALLGVDIAEITAA